MNAKFFYRYLEWSVEIEMIRTFMFLATTLAATGCFAQSFHTATAKSPEAGTMFVFPERFRTRRDGLKFCQRGQMFVPIKRSKPDSDVISIEFYRFPRDASADPNTPPIFILNGGPGFAGLDLTKSGRFESSIQKFLPVSDVVVVGQRGIGTSKPDTKIQMQQFPQPADKPFDPAKAESEFQKMLASERDAWLETGLDLSGFTVVEAAADVRDIARGLGYQKISIMGGSFGSHWGMTLIRNHPELVARALMRGMEGPDHTWDHPGWYWNVFKRVAQDAEASDELQGLIPEQGLIASLEALVNRAEREPIIVELEQSRSNVNVRIDGHWMRQVTTRYSRGLHEWPANAIGLVNGEFEQAARQIWFRSKFKGMQSSTASYWMLDTGSGITAKRRQQFEQDPAMKFVRSPFWHYAAAAPVWNIDLGDEFRSEFETHIPTVIVHGTWDVQTPYENAVELAPYFKNSKFVTVHRGSHGAVTDASRHDPDFEPAILKFLATGEMDEIPEEIELPVPEFVVPKK